MWRRRSRSLADVWAANVAAAGELEGDLAELVRQHCTVQDEMAEVEALQNAILTSEEREPSIDASSFVGERCAGQA